MTGAEGPDPDPRSLLAIIQTQTQIAKLGLDLQGVMSRVAQDAATLTRAAGAVVELAEGDEMVYRAVAGITEQHLGLRLKRDSSLSGLCVSQAQGLRCNDTEDDPRVNREACRRVGLRSMIVTPLMHNEIAVGVLKVLSETPSAFGQADIKILDLMSELIASAMYHAAKYGSDELFYRATHDELTGLANRALFYDRLRHAVSQARRDERRFGILMLDMDGLKRLNDQFGHRTGDAAIKELALRLSQDIRQADTAARLGGDEFGMIVTSVDNRESALCAGHRIKGRLEPMFPFEGKDFKLEASWGVALFPDDGQCPDSLVEKADQEMYVYKRDRKAGRCFSEVGSR